MVSKSGCPQIKAVLDYKYVAEYTMKSIGRNSRTRGEVSKEGNLAALSHGLL